MYVITFIFILVIAVYYLISKRKNKRFDELFCQLPSPPALPILGHALLFIEPSEILNNIYKILLEYNGLFAMQAPWKKFIFVSDPEIIKTLCTSNLVIKSKLFYSVFDDWFGNFILNAEGKLWKKYRTLFTPAFHVAILGQYIHTYVSASRVLIEHMKKSLGESVNVYEYLESWTINTILELGLKLSSDDKMNIDPNLGSILHYLTKIMTFRITNPMKYNDILFRFTRDYWKQRKAINILRNQMRLVMDLFFTTRDETSLNSTKQKSMFFIDILIQNRGVVLNNEEIRAHLQALLLAGFDTTATTISCVLHLLSMYQSVQEKAFLEIKSVYGADKTKSCTLDDLQKMPYLEMVIKESLRLYPPIPVIAKYNLEDLRFGKYVNPKGADIIISIDSVHKTEKYFPNPSAFVPERFAPENQANIKSFSYLPFGAGARNCLGQRVSVLLIKTAVSMVLRNFKLLPVEGFQLKLLPHIVRTPSDNGVYLILQNREE